MIRALKDSVYGILISVDGLGPGQVFFVEVPQRNDQNQNYPVCTYNMLSNNLLRDTSRDCEENFIQITLQSPHYEGVEVAEASLRGKLKIENLSVSGYDVVSCVRQFSVEQRLENRHWQIIIQYKIEIQES